MLAKTFYKAFTKIEQSLVRTVTFLRDSHPGRLILMCGGLLMLAIMLMVAAFHIHHADEKTTLGVSFSTKYANELGLNWEETYTALAEDLGFDRIRVMSYWDEYEKERNSYDFTNLDRQFEIAQANNATLDLAVGVRQPRWPECHEPSWAQDLNDDEFEFELLEYIGIVVNRYKDHPALEQYQLENEFSLSRFGECRDATKQRLQNEYDLIKSLDQDTPVVINVSNQSGVPINGPVGDKTGLSVYRKAHHTLFDLEFYWDFWYVLPPWHTARAAFIELIHDSDVFIHELQAEPWGPQATVNLSLEEQAITMDAARVRSQVEYAEATGLNEIHLWGGEWWYWHMSEFNDTSLWEEVRTLLVERDN